MIGASGRLLLSGTSPALGTWIKLACPEVVEIAAYAGFDFVVLDLEHSMLDNHTVNAMVGTARHAGIVPLVRPSGADRATIQRTLDAGAAGIIVPQVASVAEAERIVDMAMFPPRGHRGLSTSGRAGAWGDMSPQEYIERGDECIIIVQLETVEAMHQAEAIAGVAGIDAVFLGSMDLTASLGRPFDSAAIDDLVTTLESSCERAGIALGTAIGMDPGVVVTLPSIYRFLVIGSDASILRLGSQRLVQAAGKEHRILIT